MPQDLTLELRQAIVAHLRADANVTALVPAARIYGEYAGIDPEMPFIRCGDQIASSFEATCWDGMESDFNIHVFAQGPANDAVSRISKRVVASMDGFTPAALSMADNAWGGTQYMADGVSTNRHSVIRFGIAAIAA
jgi:Protein of unknown function (DUF3168)